MCGILFTNSELIAPRDFRGALDLMCHRGPDVPGNFVQHGASQFGHHRLSVVDLASRSNQPFYSHDQRHLIIFNGEIYNFRQLAQEFKLTLRTGSDTELLLELYLRIGPQCLERFVGIFALVIFDTLTDDYFIARDRLGAKPLYFAEHHGGVIVASEIAPLLRLLGGADVDPFALRQYRKMRGFFNGRTLYRRVSTFPAGHYRVNHRIVRYWELPPAQTEPPTDEELNELIRVAVNCRLVADVPIGCYLSGGLDSSVVAALAGCQHTWVTGIEPDTELPWAAEVAAHLGTTHHALTFSSDAFLAASRWMIQKRQEPLSVPNEVLLFLLTQQVKQFNTVMLSGEGADELFAGYDRVFRWASSARDWDLDLFSRHYSYGTANDPEVVEDAVAPFLDRKSPYHIVSAFFQVSHLHGLLRRLDNSTMLCGVEAREPFADHRLVERVFGLGLKWKMANGRVKAPLKRLFGHLLPGAIVDRPKLGFPVNLSAILPPVTGGAAPMDRWFEFNLAHLGLDLPIEEIASL